METILLILFLTITTSSKESTNNANKVLPSIDGKLIQVYTSNPDSVVNLIR